MLQQAAAANHIAVKVSANRRCHLLWLTTLWCNMQWWLYTVICQASAPDSKQDGIAHGHAFRMCYYVQAVPAYLCLVPSEASSLCSCAMPESQQHVLMCPFALDSSCGGSSPTSALASRRTSAAVSSLRAAPPRHTSWVPSSTSPACNNRLLIRGCKCSCNNTCCNSSKYLTLVGGMSTVLLVHQADVGWGKC